METTHRLGAPVPAKPIETARAGQLAGSAAA
jgi:hypothetical protein